MAFPISPSVNDTHVVNEITYQWSGESWRIYQSGIEGPQGATGSQGIQGIPGTDAYISNSSEFINAVNSLSLTTVKLGTWNITESSGILYFNNGSNRMNLDSLGSLTVTGDIIANSDERLKTNIREIENPIDIVNNLHGKRYVKDDKESIGLIAQEVEKILPEMVSISNDESGTKSVNYQNIIAVLIEAVKEQEIRIKTLEGK